VQLANSVPELRPAWLDERDRTVTHSAAVSI